MYVACMVLWAFPVKFSLSPAYIRCFLWPETVHRLMEVYTYILSVKIQEQKQWKRMI